MWSRKRGVTRARTRKQSRGLPNPNTNNNLDPNPKLNPNPNCQLSCETKQRPISLHAMHNKEQVEIDVAHEWSRRKMGVGTRFTVQFSLLGGTIAILGGGGKPNQTVGNGKSLRF